MALGTNAVYPLRLIQVGKESAAGTAVTETWRLIGDATLVLQQQRYMSAYPRGVRTPVTAGGVLVQAGATLAMSSELTFEEVIYPLNCGLATGVIAGTSPKTHTFTPVITGNPAVKSFTLVGSWDSSIASGVPDKIFSAKMAYGTVTQIVFDIAFGQPAKLSWNSFLRQATLAVTPTASLTALTGREVVPSDLFAVYMDDTWAGLGGTVISQLIRAAKLTINTGLMPDYTLDARNTFDFTQLTWGNLTGQLDLTMEVSSTTATEISNWFNQNAGGASNKQRFVRLIATSNNAVAKAIQLDGSYIYMKEPSFSNQNGQEICTMSLAFEYDSTSSNVFQAVISNSLATFT